MTRKIENFKQKYINAAILHSESAYNGEHKTANKQYKVLKKFYDKIEQNLIAKSILIDLLKHDNIYVRSWAATHMLGLRYEICLAEKELQNIALMLDSGMIGFSAKMTLQEWRRQGYLKF